MPATFSPSVEKQKFSTFGKGGPFRLKHLKSRKSTVETQKYYFFYFWTFLAKQLATPWLTIFSTVPPPDDARILTHWKRFQHAPFVHHIFATSFPAISGSRLFARFLTSLTSTEQQSRVKSAEYSPNFSRISPAEAAENDDKKAD